MITVMENNVAHLCPSEPLPGTLPCDLDLVMTASDSIPEELAVVKEFGDSSYESAEDIPNGSADIKSDTSLNDLVVKPSQKSVKSGFVSEKLPHVWKLLISLAVSVMFLVITVAVYSDVYNDVFLYIQQYFMPENEVVSFVATENHLSVSNSSVAIENISNSSL